MFERTKLGPVAKNAISSADNECIDANEFSHESIANESPLPMSHHCQWVTIVNESPSVLKPRLDFSILYWGYIILWMIFKKWTLIINFKVVALSLTHGNVSECRICVIRFSLTL